MLAQLAAIPELQLVIAENPATPDDVLDWLLVHGSTETRIALGEEVRPTDLLAAMQRRPSTAEDLWAEEQTYRRAREAAVTEAQAERERVLTERDAFLGAKDIAARAEEIGRWEAAWSLAHDGQAPPAGFAPPAAALSRGYHEPRPTNSMAIAALVSVFFIAILGVLFGNAALRQIRDSGEGGGGLALAAVIIGWVQLIGGAISLVIYFSVVGSLAR